MLDCKSPTVQQLLKFGEQVVRVLECVVVVTDYPGNAGAYVKKTITVETGDTMTGCTGMPCYAHLCHCRNHKCIRCMLGNRSNGNGCICARGGYGGKTMCTTGSSILLFQSTRFVL